MLPPLRFNDYIHFDDFLKLDDAMWARLHLDLCLSMSKCSVRYGTGGFQHPTYYSTRGLTGGAYLKAIVKELPEEVQERYTNMGIMEKTMFASWYLGYNSMPLIYVRGTNTYETKHTKEGSIENENTAHFQALFDWIDNSGLFNTYGRITIFMSPQGYESRKHKDLPPGTPYTMTDEFVWLNPRGKKRFYLENDEGLRREIKHRSAWFNSYQYHGAYASQEQNYGIRIDGEYSDKARAYVTAQMASLLEP